MLRREAFKKASSFTVYYGQPKIHTLSTYDIAIVEPSYYTKEDIWSLQQKKTLVIAYVSVMEVREDDPLFIQLNREDFIYQSNKPMKQETYGTYLLNLGSSHWRSIIIKRIGELFLKEGYDGVFLDTIGDAEMAHLPEPWIHLHAATQFVKDIRKWFPHMVLIQNNGLEILCQHTAPYLDAIVWENPPIELKESVQWINLISERLMHIMQTTEMRVFILFDRCEVLQHTEILSRVSFADRHHFPVYLAPTHYLTITSFKAFHFEN